MSVAALLKEHYLWERRGRLKPKIINAAKASREQFAQAKDGIADWASGTDRLASFSKGTTAGLVAVRYRYELSDIREYGGETTFRFNVIPLGGKAVQGPGLRGNPALFKSPKKALEEIPTNSQWAYRGLSWEEWQQIRKRKSIKSRGGYNIGQEGLTFFGPEPGTGHSYASGFAPVQHMASKKRPGVVIAIHKKHTLSYKDRDDIPQGELAILGSLPMSEIKGVWLLVPTESRAGMMELIRTEVRKYNHIKQTYSPGVIKWKEGSRSTPSIWTALVRLK